MIKQESIDRILDAAHIEEVVGDFVTLKKRGSSLIGVCPFHNEKTPSFYVSVSKGIYKCFGCGAGGDATRFIMEHEKYSYPEALRYLASKYQIDIEEEQQSPEQVLAKDKRESLYVVSTWAGKFFKDTLWQSEEGRQIGLNYFHERGYRDDIIEKFELGYSPESWNALVEKAKADGFSEEYLEATGLVIRRDDGSVYDRFRTRVMFPIHNLTGRIVGFGGRTLKTDKKIPKYVNSPESDIYHKSDILYGLYLAKKAIVTADNCYLVEGYADVISMHQAGVENVVSSSGTSLTEKQVRLIGRYTKNVTILFDGDEAGIKASLRGTDMLLEEGLNVKVLLFPEGNDPDSYVQKYGSTAFKTYIQENQQDFIFFKTTVLLRGTQNDPIKRAGVIREVVESIALIPDAIKASVFIRECSTLLDIEERVLLSELNKIKIDQSKKTAAKASHPEMPPADLFDPSFSGEGPAPVSGGLSADVLQEREIVRILLNYGNMPAKWHGNGDIPIAPILLGNISDVSFEDTDCNQIIEIFKEHMKRQQIPDERLFIAHRNSQVASLAVDMLSTQHSLSPNWNDDKRNIHVSHESDKLKDLVLGAVYRIKKRKLEGQIHAVRESLKTETEPANLEIVLAKYQRLKEVSREINEQLGTIVLK